MSAETSLPDAALDRAATVAAPNLNVAATGLDRRTLDAIFRHPLAHNVSWREVVNLIAAIGDSDEKHSSEFVFRVGDERMSIKKPHTKDLTGPEVIDLRHFLTRAGWSPDAGAPSQKDRLSTGPGMIVVIDHAGARIYRLGVEREAAAHPEHLIHRVDRKARDRDRDETDPGDDRFFEAVAAAVSAGGRIVVIGHGKGQSNEADHLSAYLKTHHKDAYARIVREIVADLPRLTTPELLDLGRHALG